MCTDECHTARDGVCDDGGPGTALAAAKCSVGTDCSDCSIRLYDGCQTGCFAHNRNDGVCQPACNVYACAHDAQDCSSSDIIAACSAAMPRATAIARNTSLTLDVHAELSALSVLLDEGSQEYYVRMSLVLSYSWADPRLTDPVTNPCLAIFENMLSISRAEAATSENFLTKQGHASLFWLPVTDPLLQHKVPTLVSLSFRLRDAASDAAGGRRAHLEVAATQFVKQDLFRFFYPFDKQTLKLELPFPLADASGDAKVPYSSCGSSGFATISDFPTGSEWSSSGPATSTAVDNVCVISIPVRFRPSHYIWQTLLPTTAVSLGSLFAVALDPKSGDTAAARSSVLLVAMLLLVETNASIFSQAQQCASQLSTARCCLLPASCQPPLVQGLVGGGHMLRGWALHDPSTGASGAPLGCMNCPALSCCGSPT